MNNAELRDTYADLSRRLSERYVRFHNARLRKEKNHELFQQAQRSADEHEITRAWSVSEASDEAYVKAANELHASLESYCYFVRNNEDVLFRPRYIRLRRRTGAKAILAKIQSLSLMNHVRSK